MRRADIVDGVAISFAAVCLIIGVILQSRVLLNHDVAWIGHSAGWLLDGRRIGADLLDPSPPLAWYLSLPAAALHASGVLPEVEAIRLLFWTLCAASLLLSYRVMRDLAAHGGAAERMVLLGLASIAICILPARDFGQREVMAVTLGLPYLFLLASRLESGRVARVDALIAGVAAGVGFALKPFLLAIPLMLEAVRVMRSARHGGPWLTPESVALAVVCGAYGVAVLVFSRDYVFAAVPMIRAVYWAYDAADHILISRLQDAIVPLVLGLSIALVTRVFRAIHLVLVIACLGAVASYWIQGKGFSYHVFPILVTGWILLGHATYLGIRSLVSAVHPVLGPAAAGLGVIGLAIVAVGGLKPPIERAIDWYVAFDVLRGEQGRGQQELIDELRRQGVGPGVYLYALSTHPGPAFPAVSYLGAEWAGRAATQFVIPAYFRREEIPPGPIRDEIVSMKLIQLREVTEALRLHRPKVVIVDARHNRLGLGYRKLDFVEFYSRDPAFQRIWACYSETSQVDRMRLFVLVPGCDQNMASPVL